MRKLRKRADNEKLICEKLIEMIEQKPFHEIKVVEFREYCGISRATFYTYFDSIYSVLQKIEDDFFSGLMAVSGEVKEFTRANTLSSAKYIQNNFRVFRALCGTNGEPAFQARLVSHSKRRFNTLFTRYTTKLTAAEMSLIIEFLANGQVSLLKWWAFHDDEISLNDFLKISRTLLNGVSELFIS